MSAPELVTLTIDDRQIRVPKGTGLVETALAAGVEIPVFCYEPRLGPAIGACRMCLCEIEGLPKLQAACTMTAQDGLVVRTAATSELAANGQESTLEFILLNHPLDCPDCDKGGECPLQDLTFRYGPATTRMHFPKRTFDKPIPISPLIALDRERCILCYRCTRFSEGIAEDGQLVAVNRGAQSLIATFEDEPYRAHFSGNVIELCPVGALTSTTYRFRARPWEIQNVPTVCGLCPVGCNTWATTREERVVRVVGRNHPEVDNGWLCDKGRFAYDHLRSEDRLRTPLRRVRRRGFEEISWEEALAGAEQLFRQAPGPVVVAFSGSETVEQAAALAQLALASGNGASALLPDRYDPGLDAFRAPLCAIATAQICLVAGDQPVLERAPLVDLWLRTARRNGAEIVTVHPAGSLAVPPGAAARVCEELAKKLPAARLRATARALHEAERVALVWSDDDPRGAEALTTLARALDLGEGSGVYVLPRTPNGRGVAEAWAAAGGTGALGSLPEEAGLLVVSGDEAAADPRVLELASRAGSVVVTSMFLNDATGQAHLVLPGTSYLERDGTFVNLEGRRQRLRRAVTAPAQATELDLWVELCKRFGGEASWLESGTNAERAPLAAVVPSEQAASVVSGRAAAPVDEPGAPGMLRVWHYRPLFRGAAVERISQLQFQRPAAEVELALADARAREIGSGDSVVVGSDGSARTLQARINRRLLAGVVRIADEHAEGLAAYVEIVRKA